MTRRRTNTPDEMTSYRIATADTGGRRKNPRGISKGLGDAQLNGLGIPPATPEMKERARLVMQRRGAHDLLEMMGLEVK